MEAILCTDCQNWDVRTRIILQACAKHLDYMAYVTTSIKHSSNRRSATYKTPDWAKSNHFFKRKVIPKSLLRSQGGQKKRWIRRWICQSSIMLFVYPDVTTSRMKAFKTQKWTSERKSYFRQPKKDMKRELFLNSDYSKWTLFISCRVRPKRPQKRCMQKIFQSNRRNPFCYYPHTKKKTTTTWHSCTSGPTIKCHSEFWWGGKKYYIK